MSLRLTHDIVLSIEEDLRNGVPQREIMSKYNFGHKTIRMIAKNARIPILRGRKPLNITQDAINFVVLYRDNFNVGYHRSAQAARHRGIQISDDVVKKIFKEKNLYCFKHKAIEQKKHTPKFHAKYAGQHWHTDLHYLEKINNEQLYMIAFIDDCTRYVVHWEVIDEKTSMASAVALVHALGKATKPKKITIDNGGEFIGEEFQQVLKENCIEDWRTTPHTPEQNGKVERFWRTLESARNKGRTLDIQYIQAIINEYNDVWEHSSLKSEQGMPSTPSKAWATIEHYNGQSDAGLVYTQ